LGVKTIPAAGAALRRDSENADLYRIYPSEIRILRFSNGSICAEGDIPESVIS
jgi:hypothetical protein